MRYKAAKEECVLKEDLLNELSDLLERGKVKKLYLFSPDDDASCKAEQFQAAGIEGTTHVFLNNRIRDEITTIPLPNLDTFDSSEGLKKELLR